MIQKYLNPIYTQCTRLRQGFAQYLISQRWKKLFELETEKKKKE